MWVPGLLMTVLFLMIGIWDVGWGTRTTDRIQGPLYLAMSGIFPGTWLVAWMRSRAADKDARPRIASKIKSE